MEDTYTIEPSVSDIKTEEMFLLELQDSIAILGKYQRALDDLKNGQGDLFEINKLLLSVSKTPFREETKKKLRKIQKIVRHKLNYETTNSNTDELNMLINGLHSHEITWF